MTESDRPESGEEAERMMAILDGSAGFHYCDDVTMFLDCGDRGLRSGHQAKVTIPHAKATLTDTDPLHEPRPTSSTAARPPRAMAPSPGRSC